MVYAPVVPKSSQAGYTDVMWNPDVTKCTGDGPSLSSGWLGPAGCLLDNPGRLYMMSDVTFNIYLWIFGRQ
jgi:hypothetical protein